MVTRVTLRQMNEGEDGVVAEFLSGRGMRERLSALGIRPGVKIKKVGTASKHGPVVIQAGRSQTAIGCGMSHKIIVEVER